MAACLHLNIGRYLPNNFVNITASTARRAAVILVSNSYILKDKYWIL